MLKYERAKHHLYVQNVLLYSNAIDNIKINIYNNHNKYETKQKQLASKFISTSTKWIAGFLIFTLIGVGIFLASNTGQDMVYFIHVWRYSGLQACRLQMTTDTYDGIAYRWDIPEDAIKNSKCSW